MKLSNFRHLKQTDSFVYASVDVETGFLWWKRTEIGRRIGRCLGGGDWRFNDTGEIVPESSVDLLMFAHILTKGENQDE